MLAEPQRRRRPVACCDTPSRNASSTTLRAFLNATLTPSFRLDRAKPSMTPDLWTRAECPASELRRLIRWPRYSQIVNGMGFGPQRRPKSNAAPRRELRPEAIAGEQGRLVVIQAGLASRL